MTHFLFNFFIMLLLSTVLISNITAHNMENVNIAQDKLYAAIFQPKDLGKFIDRMIETIRQGDSQMQPVWNKYRAYAWYGECVKGEYGGGSGLNSLDMSDFGLSQEEVEALDLTKEEDQNRLKKAYIDLFSKTQWETKLFWISTKEMMAGPACGHDSAGKMFDGDFEFDDEANFSGLLKLVKFGPVTMDSNQFEQCAPTLTNGKTGEIYYSVVCGDWHPEDEAEKWSRARDCIACAISRVGYPTATFLSLLLVALVIPFLLFY